MISKYSSKSSDIANELAISMQNTLTKTAEAIATEKRVETVVNNLIRSAELFEQLDNHKASEIITKIIEKLALNSGK